MNTLTRQRTRILFFAEAVSLAHVTRLLTLAKSLPKTEWEIHFACGDAYRFLLADSGFFLYRVNSITPETFLRRLALSVPAHIEEDLIQYVEEDRQLLGAIAPDLVVGDLRLSLSISARQMVVPYVSLTNAYWSPYFIRWPFPPSQASTSKIFGVSLPSKTLQIVQDRIFGLHMRPMNLVRSRYGRPPVNDIRELYTDGDWVIYADSAMLVPTVGMTSQHAFIGPLVWSPESLLPEWWNSLPTDRPTNYLNLGSTGKISVLPDVLEAIASIDANIMLATAGRFTPSHLPKNVWVADYIPGTLASARADVVICNGGSGSTYQALAHGRPLLGICSNMDQYLTMDCVEAAGAGMHLLSTNATVGATRDALLTLLSIPSYTAAARRFQDELEKLDTTTLFGDVVKLAISNGKALV